jgi:UPF0755 protein
MHRSRLGSIALVLLVACAPDGSAPVERVTIPPGTSLGQVAESLAAHQVIESRRWFRTLARLRGVERSVKAGVYEFRRGSGAWRALGALNRGAVVAIRFTAPEGLTLWDLADLAEDQLGVPADSILVAATDTSLARALGMPGESLEGYLLPETYLISAGSSSREVVGMMVREFLRQWPPAWDSRLDTLHLSRRALLSLAAIVEAESRHEDERAIVAGVYWNRLRLGMPLQADPTVQYAIEARTGERKPRLYYKDLAIPSPYNTYLHAGLPPGPINSPGIASMRAALYPDSVPFLYFVAGMDGRHIFSRTLAEHARAVALARRQRALEQKATARP